MTTPQREESAQPLGTSGRPARMVTTVVSLAVTAVFIGYCWQNAERFSELAQFTVAQVAILAMISLSGHAIAATKFWTMTRTLNARMPALDAFWLTEAGALVNILPLNLGTPMRALYMKRVLKLSFTNFGIGFTAFLVSSLLVGGTLGVVVTLRTPGASPLAYVLFGGYLLAAGSALLLARTFGRDRSQSDTSTESRRGVLARFGTQLRDGVALFVNAPQAFALFFVLDVAATVIAAAQYSLIGSWLGMDIDFADGVLLHCVTRGAGLVAVIPAGTVGLREAFAGAGLGMIGAAFVDGVVIATVDRLVGTAWILVLGSAGWIVLSRRVAKSTIERA